jgi:hypothetical protein
MSPPIVSTLGKAHRGTRQGRDRGRGKHREQGQKQESLWIQKVKAAIGNKRPQGYRQSNAAKQNKSHP